MRSTIAHGKTRYQPNFRVHPDMDDEPNVGLYRPDRTFTIGSPQAYYAFFSIDPEFRTYFKVKADIDSDMDATQENIDHYSGLIHAMARKQGDECDDEVIVRLLGELSRSAANRTKLEHFRV